ncbi:hypothetical protein L0P50_11910 [Lawsonibacter sp. DFI.6.74]|nr:hypothetical protein [Lawsonibacter sp. DFI.6.74]MCG4774068.1 hypothetical protein [Lawsonibacter sp. DFI.5.51]
MHMALLSRGFKNLQWYGMTIGVSFGILRFYFPNCSVMIIRKRAVFAYFRFYVDSWGREKTTLPASPIQEEMELERFLSLPVGWWSQAEN